MTDTVTTKLRKGPGPDPVRGIYGFVLYLAGFLSFGVFLVWAYFPPDILYSVGLTYWPQRYWAIALPVYFTCFVALFFVMLAGYNLLHVEPIDSFYCIQDDTKLESAEEDRLTPSLIPTIRDVPIDVYCRQMYRLPSNSHEEDS